jgi:Na+-translocating ferredoxin:NAD+ oxidoreductase subunit E
MTPPIVTTAHGEAAAAARGGATVAPGARRPPTPATDDLLRGVWRENPVLVQFLGLCPALAVTNTVANSIAMGAATFFVLTGSSVLVSLLRRFTPHEVRISTYVLIIATFVTLADMALEAVVPDIHKALGAFIALIVCNCMILGRQEAFASRRPVGRAFLDAAGTGAGFVIALLLMGGVREVLGSGSLLGVRLFGPQFEPWIIMILPPGGFLTLGVLLLALSWWRRRQQPGPGARPGDRAGAAEGVRSDPHAATAAGETGGGRGLGAARRPVARREGATP